MQLELARSSARPRRRLAADEPVATPSLVFAVAPWHRFSPRVPTSTLSSRFKKDDGSAAVVLPRNRFLASAHSVYFSDMKSVSKMRHRAAARHVMASAQRRAIPGQRRNFRAESQPRTDEVPGERKLGLD
jgi:hypothetical protein